MSDPDPDCEIILYHGGAKPGDRNYAVIRAVYDEVLRGWTAVSGAGWLSGTLCGAILARLFLHGGSSFFKPLFVIAREPLDTVRPHPQHPDLKLYNRLQGIDADFWRCGDPPFVEGIVCHLVCSFPV
jgi:hypothetical protein